MKTIKGPKAKMKPPKPQDVTDSVRDLYEIAKAADAFDRFMAKHAPLVGTGLIHIAFDKSSPEVHQELVDLVTRLQLALRPFRAAVDYIETVEAQRN